MEAVRWLLDRYVSFALGNPEVGKDGFSNELFDGERVLTVFGCIPDGFCVLFRELDAQTNVFSGSTTHG